MKGPSFVEVASKRLLGLVGLLREEYSLDVWQYTILDNGHSREKLQLLVIMDGQLQVIGMILVFLLSREALPANSRTSVAR